MTSFDYRTPHATTASRQTENSCDTNLPLQRVILFVLIVAMGLASTMSPARAAIPAYERDSLLEIYTQTDGVNWTQNDGWGGPPGTECNWYGITCDITQSRVEYLILDNNHLVGTLGNIDSLLGLPDLIMLTVDDNQLTGTLLFGGYPALRYVYIQNNQFDGYLNTLEGCTGLETFWAFNNEFIGPIPSLDGLTNLKRFDVSDNAFSGSLPSLAGLAKLEVFDVSQLYAVTGTIPTLAGHAKLRLFDATGDDLSGSIPSLAGLPALEYFRVDDNQLTGTIPALSGLTNLKGFTAGSNNLSGAIPALTGLYQLETLALKANALTGHIPALAGLGNLAFVSLHDNELDGPIPPLTGLIKLKSFYVQFNHLTGGIPSLAGLESLEALHLGDNRLTGGVPPVPSPNHLLDGGSQLCPNPLAHVENPAWDAAVGLSPWYGPPAQAGSCTEQPLDFVFTDGFEGAP